MKVAGVGSLNAPSPKFRGVSRALAGGVAKEVVSEHQQYLDGSAVRQKADSALAAAWI